MMSGKEDLTRLVIGILLTGILVVVNITVIVTVITLIPFWLTLRLLAKYCRPDLGSVVTGGSSAFTIYPAERCPASLNHFLILDGALTVPRFRQLFSERIMEARRSDAGGELIFPRFRDTWTELLGYSFWKPETDFSLEHHVREYDLKGELTLPVPCTESDLVRVMGGISGKLWEPGRSPWEALLIQNYRAEDDESDCTVILFRHHHALIDGYGLVSFIRALFGTKYTLPKLQVPRFPLWFRILAPFKMPYDSAFMFMDLLEGSEAGWRVKAETPRDLVTSITRKIRVEEIKRIKNKLGVSYTAVLFTALAGALGKMAQDEGLCVPEGLGVHYPIPKPDHPGGTVNHVYMVGMRWEIKSGSPLYRARSIQRSMNALRHTTITEMGSWIYWGIGIVPTFLRRAIFINLITSGTTIASCFPATTDTVYFEGMRVRDMISCVGALGNLSLAVLITGLNGSQHVVVTGNKHIFPERCFRKLGTYIEEEIRSLDHY